MTPFFIVTAVKTSNLTYVHHHTAYLISTFTKSVTYIWTYARQSKSLQTENERHEEHALLWCGAKHICWQVQQVWPGYGIWCYYCSFGFDVSVGHSVLCHTFNTMRTSSLLLQRCYWPAARLWWYCTKGDVGQWLVQWEAFDIQNWRHNWKSPTADSKWLKNDHSRVGARM
jgi:hypothetical protein